MVIMANAADEGTVLSQKEIIDGGLFLPMVIHNHPSTEPPAPTPTPINTPVDRTPPTVTLTIGHPTPDDPELPYGVLISFTVSAN